MKINFAGKQFPTVARYVEHESEVDFSLNYTHERVNNENRFRGKAVYLLGQSTRRA